MQGHKSKNQYLAEQKSMCYDQYPVVHHPTALITSLV